MRTKHTGTSLTFGYEKITTTEKLAEACTGESLQSAWSPVRRPEKPLLLAFPSMPSVSDVVSLLRELGCTVHSIPVLGPSIPNSPYVVGDGIAASYRLRLRVDWRTVDEAELNLTT